jgi:processive 1,2-diacylglycerol beta-glucosyltransferase
MIRVHVLYEYGVDHRPHGSAYIRLLNPLRHPSIAGRIELTAGEDLQSAEVVIVDRTWKYDVTLHAVEALIAQIREAGACLLYSIDDNLLDLDLSGGFRSSFTLEQLTVIRLLAREADGLLVSTPALAERLRRMNEAIYVLPNALDERLFPDPALRAATATRPLVVGYMGTFTHDDDLYLILEALRAHAGHIELQLVGGISDAAILKGFQPLSIQVLNPAGHHEYPDFIRWMGSALQWDLGLAPLEDTPFTRCKSDIKFLDYSLMGIPGIYSRVEAYRHTVQHGVTGWLAGNTVSDWRDGLAELIHQPDLRRRLALSAGQWVGANRTLAVCATQWADAIETVVRNTQHRKARST